MKRRNFLSSLSTATLLAMLNNSVFALPLAAVSRRKRNFVLIKVANGWDVTLGLDPKTHADGSDQQDVFLEYTADDVKTVGGLKFGPAAVSLVPHGADLAIINGIAMAPSDTGHIAGLNYISTGNGQGHAPDLPVEVAVSTEAGLLGVVSDSLTSTLNRKIFVTTTDSLKQSVRAIDLDIFSNFASASPNKGEFTEAMLSAASDPAVHNALKQEIMRRQTLIDGIQASGLSFYEKNMQTSAQLLASAFTTKAAFSGQIFTQFNLDTHSDHEKNHLGEQTKMWSSVAEIFNIFKSTPSADTPGSSLWDSTLFMVVSEFSRTPALNSSKGKDHNPLTNSVLLAGGLVRSGTVGASAVLKRKDRSDEFPLHAALPIDFSTGAVATSREQAEAENFRYIQPENVVNTVATIMGVDRRKFQSVAQGTPILSSLIK